MSSWWERITLSFSPKLPSHSSNSKVRNGERASQTGRSTAGPRTFFRYTAGGVKKATRSKKEPADALWNFSLRYWVQLDWFGLHGKGIDNQWLVSVLERLKQLSSEPIERVYRDGVMRDAMRYHPINWQATNIPIAKTEIPGLPSYCIDNPEFELHQFQISKGKGRVVGFFDESWVFNIVLLVPLHNLQPSKSFGYAV